MKMMINTLGKNLIFTDINTEMDKATLVFSGPFMFLYPNKKPEKMVEVEIEINENGIAKMSKELEELFTLRHMDDQQYECIGPYNEDGEECYTINVKSIPDNPIKEGAILEHIDFERNKATAEFEVIEDTIDGDGLKDYIAEKEAEKKVETKNTENK